MNNRAIVVEQLSKRYEIGKLARPHDTLRESIVETFASPFRKLASFIGRNGINGGIEPEPTSFWALRNVSFEVERGEVVGIIGHNGAGKSTLLKILSRIMDPTCGFAEIDGRVSSLLEVGTGFNAELSGRENIYLSGAVLGMKRAHINHNFDKIVAFSEVEKFIDTPVKHYSSGMYLRLAFAVAAHLDPEILLIDEVLAVGDAAFQRKCLGKMEDVSKAGRTVLFVSHNMGAVRNLCSRAILLNQGRMQSSGATQDVIQEYLSIADWEQTNNRLSERQDRSGSGNVRAVSFEACASGDKDSPPKTGSACEFIVGYAAHHLQSISTLYVGIGVTDILGTGVFYVSTAMKQGNFRAISATGQVVCQIDQLPLLPGKYQIHLKLQDNYGLADYIKYAGSFDVIDGGDGEFTRYAGSRDSGSVVVPHTWTLRHSGTEIGDLRAPVGELCLP